MKIKNKKIKKILKEIKLYPEFYQKVWKTVLKIPKGEVRSYKWIAEKVNSPGGYRAVGQALKNNPFAPLIPCHRVVRSDGSLGGYNKGKKLKYSLLLKEGVKIKFK